MRRFRKAISAFIAGLLIFTAFSASAGDMDEESICGHINGITAEVFMDRSSEQELLGKLDSAAMTAKNSHDKPVFRIHALCNQPVKGVKIHLPAWLLTAAVEKRIEKVVMDTEVGSMAVVPDVDLIAGFEELVLCLSREDQPRFPDLFQLPLKKCEVYDFSVSSGLLELKDPVPVQVTIPYKQGEGDKTTVYRVNKDWEFEKLPAVSYANTVELSADHPGKYLIGIEK